MVSVHLALNYNTREKNDFQKIKALGVFLRAPRGWASDGYEALRWRSSFYSYFFDTFEPKMCVQGWSGAVPLASCGWLTRRRRKWRRKWPARRAGLPPLISEWRKLICQVHSDHGELLTVHTSFYFTAAHVLLTTQRDGLSSVYWTHPWTPRARPKVSCHRCPSWPGSVHQALAPLSGKVAER